MSEATKKPTEGSKNPYAYDPSKYNPNMGTKDGRVDEIRSFFHVIPGHEKAIREGILKFSDAPGRRLLKTNLLVAAHTQTLTLFDNDTRFLFSVDFDVDWDPYIDDSVGFAGMDRYWLWWSHVEEFANYSPENPPTLAQVKYAFNACRESAVVHINAFPDVTLSEHAKRADVWEAFQKVINSPEGAKALENPALKPLLDLAAD